MLAVAPLVLVVVVTLSDPLEEAVVLEAVLLEEELDELDVLEEDEELPPHATSDRAIRPEIRAATTFFFIHFPPVPKII